MHGVVQLLIPDRAGVTEGQELPANRLQGPPHVDNRPAVLVLVVDPFPRGQVVLQPTYGAVVGLVDVDVVRRQEAAVGHGHVWPLGVLLGVTSPVPLANEVGDQPHISRPGTFSSYVSVVMVSGKVVTASGASGIVTLGANSQFPHEFLGLRIVFSDKLLVQGDPRHALVGGREMLELEASSV